MEQMVRENSSRGGRTMGRNNTSIVRVSITRSYVVVFMIKDSGEVEVVLVPK